jgi:transposase InsO family protein
MNGILKLEYGLDGRFRDLARARRAVRESIWLYNYERPHLALAYRTPAQMHTSG